MIDYKAIPDQEILVTNVIFNGLSKIKEKEIKGLCKEIYNSNSFHSLLKSSNNFLILLNELGTFKELTLKLEEDVEFKSAKPVPIKLIFEGVENNFALKIGSYILKDDPSLYFNMKIFNIANKLNTLYFNTSQGINNNRPFEFQYNFPFKSFLTSFQLILKSKENFGYYSQNCNKISLSLTKFLNGKNKISFITELVDETHNTIDEKLPILIRKSLFPNLVSSFGFQFIRNSLDNTILPSSGTKNELDFNFRFGAADKAALKLFNKFTIFHSFSYFNLSQQTAIGLTSPSNSLLASNNFVSGGPFTTKVFAPNSLGQHLGKYNVGSIGLINLNFELSCRKVFKEYFRPGIFLNTSFLTNDRSFKNWDKNISFGVFFAINLADKIRLEIISGFPLTSTVNSHKGLQFGFSVDV
jgi:hypothetical protein